MVHTAFVPSHLILHGSHTPSLVRTVRGRLRSQDHYSCEQNVWTIAMAKGTGLLHATAASYLLLHNESLITLCHQTWAGGALQPLLLPH